MKRQCLCGDVGEELASVHVQSGRQVEKGRCKEDESEFDNQPSSHGTEALRNANEHENS